MQQKRIVFVIISVIFIFKINAQSNLDSTKRGYGKGKVGIFFKRYFDIQNSGGNGRYKSEEKITDRISFPFESSDYELVFIDNFDTLDRKVWGTGQPWGQFHGDHLMQYYDDSAIHIKDGKLYLQNRVAPKKFNFKDSIITIKYGTGMVNTAPSNNFTYGYFAIRSKNPAGYGTWPAFWLTGKNNWPPEIDIFEMLSRCEDGNIHKQTMSVHYGKIETQTKGSITKEVRLDANTDSVFHVYACLWEPGQITFFTDGIKLKTIKLNAWMEQFFREPMYVLINNSVDKAYVNCIDDAKLPVSLVVDWVMVFQKKQPSVQ